MESEKKRCFYSICMTLLSKLFTNLYHKGSQNFVTLSLIPDIYEYLIPSI